MIVDRAPGLHLTYCTNIHPAVGWDAVFANLQQFGPALKKRLSPASPFGIGLRLSALGVRSITFLKLLPLLGLLALGIAPLLFAARPAPAQSFWTLDTGRAVLLVVFSLQGFEVVPVLAGRAHDRRHARHAGGLRAALRAAARRVRARARSAGGGAGTADLRSSGLRR